MKKIIIILALIFGLTKLTAADNAPMDFGTFIKSATPTVSHFGHRSVMNAYKHPLLPSFLRTPELTSALEKYLPKTEVNSLAYNTAKFVLVASAAIAGCVAYRYYYPAPKPITFVPPLPFNTFTYGAPTPVHSPRIGIDIPITNLELTITIQRNGWLAPVTIEINEVNDGAGSDAFLGELQRNLTDAEKETTGETVAGNVALLQENQTYTFTISGNVTYQNRNHYELQEEQVITTQRGADRDVWIRTFWRKNIAARIASVWRELPGDLIDDRTTIYHAVISVISDQNTEKKLHSLSVPHKEDFKEQVIKALASEIFADTVKQVEIKISATTGKDHFALAPMRVSIDAPVSDEEIYQGLQRLLLVPALALAPGQLTQRAAQIEYATQLWNSAYRDAFTTIIPVEPVTTQENLMALVIFLGTGYFGRLAIEYLRKNDLLGTVVGTGMGIAALTQMNSLYQKNNVLGTFIATGAGIAALREIYTHYM